MQVQYLGSRAQIFHPYLIELAPHFQVKLFVSFQDFYNFHPKRMKVYPPHRCARKQTYEDSTQYWTKCSLSFSVLPPNIYVLFVFSSFTGLFVVNLSSAEVSPFYAAIN